MALIVIATAQPMVVLDSTIVNIALPSIQSELHVPAGSLVRIVNAYALAFGGLLLLGGKSSDLYGRRRMFRIGITLFVVASALGGFADNETTAFAVAATFFVAGLVVTALAINTEPGITRQQPRNKSRRPYISWH